MNTRWISAAVASVGSVALLGVGAVGLARATDNECCIPIVEFAPPNNCPQACGPNTPPCKGEGCGKLNPNHGQCIPMPDFQCQRLANTQIKVKRYRCEINFCFFTFQAPGTGRTIERPGKPPIVIDPVFISRRGLECVLTKTDDPACYVDTTLRCTDPTGAQRFCPEEFVDPPTFPKNPR